MSYVRSLLGQGRDHIYFYGDEKITEMEEDDRGVIAFSSVPGGKNSCISFIFTDTDRASAATGGRGLRDPKMKWRADSKDLSDLHTLLSTDLFILYLLAPYPVRDGL